MTAPVSHQLQYSDAAMGGSQRIETPGARFQIVESHSFVCWFTKQRLKRNIYIYKNLYNSKISIKVRGLLSKEFQIHPLGSNLDDGQLHVW